MLDAAVKGVRELVVEEAVIVPDKSISQVGTPALGADVGPMPPLHVPVVAPGQSVRSQYSGGRPPEARMTRGGGLRGCHDRGEKCQRDHKPAPHSPGPVRTRKVVQTSPKSAARG